MKPFQLILIIFSIVLQAFFSCEKPLNERKSENIYNVSIPFNYNSKEYKIELTCEKSDYNTVNITNATSNLSSIPNSFYTLLLDDFSIKNRLMEPENFEKSYQFYKKNGFVENELISYKKDDFRNFYENLMYIIDINDDGFDDILIIDSQNSMNDASVYKTFFGAKNSIALKNDFFKNDAFFGWDKTEKFIITGISDTNERRLTKNKIIRNSLVSVEKCTEDTVSEQQCW